MESLKRNLKQKFSAVFEEPRALFPILGFVFTSLAGTLLHFLPDLVQNNFVYLFAPTNESVWEHLKLLFYPYLLFMILEYFAYGRDADGFLGAKTRGVFAGEAVIVAVHYIVSGIVGADVAWVDISLFFVGTAVAYILPYLMIKRGASKRYSNLSAAVLLIFHAALFSVFTFMPPEIGLFMDPESGGFGIS